MITMNTDRIVRRIDFKGRTGLVVSSMFRTIQGEGPLTGRTSVFLRLSGCNFGDKSDHCKFCDTSFELDKGTHYELSDLLDKLTGLPGYYPGDALVITGGEPTLQANLLEFCKCAKPYFDTIQIETNGTQAYFFDLVPSSIITVVSPKPSHKLGGYAPLSPTVLAKASCLKFVISADPNSIHHEVPEWGLSASRPTWSPTYVSPMAEYKQPYAGEVSSIWDDSLIDREATAWNYVYAAAYTMRHNLRLSLQTHLFTAVP